MHAPWEKKEFKYTHLKNILINVTLRMLTWVKVFCHFIPVYTYYETSGKPMAFNGPSLLWFFLRLMFICTFFACQCTILHVGCYGRPLFHAWLLNNLNAIPNNGENSLKLNDYGIGLSSGPSRSNPAWSLYFCYVFVFLFLLYSFVH